MAILAAAVGVGLGHAVLPDHWVPLAVLGRTRQYPMSKIARLSGLAGIAHVLVSIVLGAVIIAIGLQFRSSVQSAQDAIVGGLLLLTGAGFIIAELLGRGHHHGPGGHTHDSDDHHHADEHHSVDDGGAERRAWWQLSAVMVPFGAAASPDLTILPVFLAATAAGVATAIISVVLFAAATIGTIVGLTLAAAVGGYQLQGEWLERWGNTMTATVLLIIGGLVLFGVI